MENKNFQYLTIGIVAIIVLYVFYNFLGKIKSADITLVPAGSQAAYNSATGMPSVVNSPGTGSTTAIQTGNSGSITNAGTTPYDVMVANNQAFASAGTAFGNFAGSIF